VTAVPRLTRRAAASARSDGRRAPGTTAPRSMARVRASTRRRNSGPPPTDQSPSSSTTRRTSAARVGRSEGGGWSTPDKVALLLMVHL